MAGERGLSCYGVLARFGARRFPKGERKALWCAHRRILFVPEGIDVPTTARIGTCRPIGTFICFDRRTRRGAGGERKAPCKQRREPTLPEKIFFLGDGRADYGAGAGLAVPWFPASFGARKFPKGERKALWCARRRISLAPDGE